MKTLLSTLSIFLSVICHVWSMQTNELLISGGFESTNIGNWFAGYYPGGNINSSGIITNPTKAHNGSVYGYVGDLSVGYSNADGYLAQYFIIPTNTLYLDVSYFLNISSSEGMSQQPDQLFIYIRNFTNGLSNFAKETTLHRFSNLNKSAGTGSAYYTNLTSHFNPTIYTGEWASIIFKVKTDSNSITAFRIDDVSVKAICSDPPPAVWTLTPSVSNAVGGVISPASPFVVTNGDATARIFTATPNGGYEVYAWYDNGSVSQFGGTNFGIGSIITNHTVSVLFTQIMYRLDVQISGCGTYTASPPGPYYPSGSIVQLTAIPSNGYKFVDWSGDCYSICSTNVSLATGTSSANAGACMFPELKKSFLASTERVNTMRLQFAPLLPASSPVSIDRQSSSPIVNFVFQAINGWKLVIYQADSILSGFAPITVITNGSATVTSQANQLEGYSMSEAVPNWCPARFLRFPIHEATTPHTWLTAPITAIMDHEPARRLAFSYLPSNDGHFNMVTYFGDSLQCDTYTLLKDKQTRLYEVTLTDEIRASMRQLEFYYPGSTLSYNNHCGYDYGFATTTVVYPAYEGDTVIEGDPDFADTFPPGTISKWIRDYHAIIIKHCSDQDPINQMGYCTVYLHLSKAYSGLINTNNTDNWVATGKTHITTNQPIGEVGTYYKADGGVGAHLHFEVWRLNPDDHKWYCIDPYGSFAQDGKPIDIRVIDSDN